MLDQSQQKSGPQLCKQTKFVDIWVFLWVRADICAIKLKMSVEILATWYRTQAKMVTCRKVLTRVLTGVLTNKGVLAGTLAQVLATSLNKGMLAGVLPQVLALC